MNDTNKMKRIEKFVQELTNARKALEVIKPDLYNTSIQDILDKCVTDNDIYEKLIDILAEYIMATCPSTMDLVPIGKSKLQDIISTELNHTDRTAIIGDEFIDNVAFKIIWWMFKR